MRWILGIALSIIISLAVVRACGAAIVWKDLGLGWALAFANAAAAVRINRLSFRSPDHALRWGLVGNALRALLFIAMIGLFKWLGKGDLFGFVTAVLTGFFLCLMNEIVDLLEMSATDRRTG